MDKKTQCCNPFNESHRAFDPVIQVNADLASKARNLNKRITLDQMICTSCRKKIHTECGKLDKPGTSTSGEPPAKKTSHSCAHEC